MMIKRIFALVTAWGFTASAFAQASGDKPSIESFFRLPQYASMRLSPDGENITALAPVKGRQNLVVLNVATRSAVPVTELETKDVVSVSWINNKRLMFQTGKLGERVFDARGGGIFAIDRDGGAVRQISEGTDERMSGGLLMTFRPVQPVRTLPGDSDDLIAQEYVVDQRKVVAGPLYRIDTRTGRRTVISSGKPDGGDGERWVVDRNGVARALTVQSEDRIKIYYRAGADAPWQKLDEFDPAVAGQWFPLTTTIDGKGLVVSSQRGRDKAAIMQYDPEKKTFGEVMAAHPQVDLGDLVGDKEGTRGVRYEADRFGYAWFDADLASVQAAADKAFPNTVNSLSWSLDRQRYLITTFSDVSPSSFYLFDKKAGKIEWLADSRPWIDPKKLAPMQPVRYKARDGLEVPGYLTLPRGGPDKNLPMVVMIHGGPWVPGDGWYYHPEVQFLASRGYAVLQPNFRGTTRYGWKHYSSSFKQWGLAMQDDISDGVKWAVDQGVADPNRVCIYGASYGGYATMMGLAKTPELYKCGINYVGVTDLPLMLTATWSDFAYSDFVRFGAKRMVGDIDKDAAQLKATSPTELAERIRAPVLMAYGAEDRRVPIEHGTKMKSALERHGKKPIWIVAEGEGHGFRDMKNQVLFYAAMEKFLEEHVGRKP